MDEGAFPPALVLTSDGQPTDDFEAELRALMSEPWGARAVRLAVAIGRDAHLDSLQRFIGNEDIAPVTASNPGQLVEAMSFASTLAVRMASLPEAERPVFEAPTFTAANDFDGAW